MLKSLPLSNSKHGNHLYHVMHIEKHIYGQIFSVHVSPHPTSISAKCQKHAFLKYVVNVVLCYLFLLVDIDLLCDSFLLVTLIVFVC